MPKQYGVRKYPNKQLWYVYDYLNRVVVSTPWYTFASALSRADWYNGDA